MQFEAWLTFFVSLKLDFGVAVRLILQQTKTSRNNMEEKQKERKTMTLTIADGTVVEAARRLCNYATYAVARESGSAAEPNYMDASQDGALLEKLLQWAKARLWYLLGRLAKNDQSDGTVGGALQLELQLPNGAGKRWTEALQAASEAFMAAHVSAGWAAVAAPQMKDQAQTWLQAAEHRLNGITLQKVSPARLRTGLII